MNVITKTEKINIKINDNIFASLKSYFRDKYIIRFFINEFSEHDIIITYSYITDINLAQEHDDIFDFFPRKIYNNSEFNAILIVPTGIGAEIGGHSGDAMLVSKLISKMVDNLITHPNVVNAADINEMEKNTIYLEGSNIEKLIMGSIGLIPNYNNRTLLLYDNNNSQKTRSLTINMASAAMITLGNEIKTLGINDPPLFNGEINDFASGTITNIDKLLHIIEENVDDFDNIAYHSNINISNEINDDYFTDKLSINPFGGLEAIITHTISNIFKINCAHAPIVSEYDYINNIDEIIDPVKTPEIVTKTELFCVLKGLSRAPKIVYDKTLFNRSNIITNEKISCIIIPDRCLNLSILSALEQNIKVIVVNDKTNVMNNNLNILPDKYLKNIIRAKNYYEVIGILLCIKNNINYKLLSRPIIKPDLDIR